MTVETSNKICPITITEGALKEVRLLVYEKEIPADHSLRIGVKGGGCSGMSYVLGFDIKQDGDDIFEQDGIKIIINKAQAMYLAGMEVDFMNGLKNRGFVFNNPNATDTCGCGSSFSA